MKRTHNLVVAVLLGLLLLVLALAYEHDQIARLRSTVDSMQSSLARIDAAILNVANTASTSAATAAQNIAELARREQVAQKSQDQQLQSAVAAATPAVVSIVESKEVPLLKVTYQNPFGNDPFFRGFGVQVPVYQQVGTTTQKVSAGTGFFVRASGYIVTNKHVVPDSNATYTVLLADGRQKVGTVLWRSQTQDLAVVKVSGSGYTSLVLGDSSQLHLAESVFAVGNALGQYNNSVSVGVISGLNRTISAQNDTGQVETLNGVIQTDAAINPGNSGGPLVDLSGKAVGVNVAVAKGSQSIGFSIPISEVKSALAQLGI